MKRVRLDVLLVEKGYFETREKAKRSIMAGLVHSENELLDKPGVRSIQIQKLPLKEKQYLM